MFWPNRIRYGYMWSPRRRCTPSLSEIKMDFLVFSVLPGRTLTTVSRMMNNWERNNSTFGRSFAEVDLCLFNYVHVRL